MLGRDAIRASTYCVDGFGAEAFTTQTDSVYDARDHTLDGKRLAQAHRTAELVDAWSISLATHQDLFALLNSWDTAIHGLPVPQSTTSPLNYDLKLLEDRDTFLPEMFLQIVDRFSKSNPEEDKYRIMFFLSTLSFLHDAKHDLAQTLLAFATVPKLRLIHPPAHQSYELTAGYIPQSEMLTSIANDFSFDFEQSPESKYAALPNESLYATRQRLVEEYTKSKNERAVKFAEGLTTQWPAICVSTPVDPECHEFIHVDNALRAVQPHFESWYKNFELKQFIDQTQVVLNSLTPSSYVPPVFPYRYPEDDYQRKAAYLSLEHAFSTPAPRIGEVEHHPFASWIRGEAIGMVDDRQLNDVLRDLGSSTVYETEYLEHLLTSLKALTACEDSHSISLHPTDDVEDAIQRYIDSCQNLAEVSFKKICDRLKYKSSPPMKLATEAGFSPRLSPTMVLEHLSLANVAQLTNTWKQTLIRYGLALSSLQHAERILKRIKMGLDMLPELLNTGCRGWKPSDYPDWLLFEIENDMLIRPVQAEIALEMISPSAKQNSIMQLNMGEGKSSVIVPIVAAALADRNKLVRVVVLRPLAKQMFSTMVKKLGGLVGRRIYQVPISRSLHPDKGLARTILNLYKECCESGGILLLQPEHILSFELLGLDRLLTGDFEAGNEIVGIQRWLNDTSRDILDESDEILSVNFELVYTMGTPRTVEFSPHRWTIIQAVLELMNKFSKDILDLFPLGLEVHPIFPRSTQFRIRVLHPEAGQKLIELIATSICEGGLLEVPVLHFPKATRELLFSYLTGQSAVDAPELLESSVSQAESARRDLLLLRGLLGGGILLFAVTQKRWRVNYGLDLSRTMLAVPYRAKDTPAPRASFSHPDVSIVLTALSYYYGGLSNKQLTIAFKQLLQGDHAQEEYELWVRDAPKLLSTFHKITSVNLQNLDQCKEQLFPHLRFSRGAVNYYLCHLVFPKEMKEFPHKISCSGWDIGRHKTHPTTGFSGTNDSRYILPLSVHQCSLKKQLHTNAKQLLCVLRPENTFYPGDTSDGGEFDADILLRLVASATPPIQVILDVGAQVLELENEQLAQQWLAKGSATHAEAVVYFDDDELVVLTRDGHKEALNSSPYAMQLDKCIVYLDEAHTRGTDLALPTNYRAAVTLGPNITKDRLLQGELCSYI